MTRRWVPTPGAGAVARAPDAAVIACAPDAAVVARVPDAAVVARAPDAAVIARAPDAAVIAREPGIAGAVARVMVFITLACVTVVAGCSSPPAPPETPPPVASAPPSGPPIRFAFETIDGKQLTTESLAGRISVIGFVASYDIASQAQVRFLTGLLKRHVPRINVAILVLEPPQNLPMVEAFVGALRLPYPAALADAATIAGQGPFAGLHHVPSVVILDREGHERWRHVGLIEENEMEAAVRDVEIRVGDPVARE